MTERHAILPVSETALALFAQLIYTLAVGSADTNEHRKRKRPVLQVSLPK